MKKPDNSAYLSALILKKESEYLLEKESLYAHFHETYESLKPSTIIKDTIREVFISPEIKSTLIKGVMGFFTGYLIKKIAKPEPVNSFSVLEKAASKLINENKLPLELDELKAITAILLRKITGQLSKSQNQK